MTHAHLAPLPGLNDPTLHLPPVTPASGVRRRPVGMRIGDTERDQTCEVLAIHFAAGRLRPDELDERTSRAVQATTAQELLRLTADLPPMGVHRPGVAAVSPVTPAVPAPDHGRGAIMVLWGLLTAAAALCTMLLLFGAAVSDLGGTVWLAAFGAAVASSGITYFVTRAAR